MFDLYKDLLGAQYEYGGRGPRYDCWGLVRVLSARFGVELPEYPLPADYLEQIHAAMALAIKQDFEEIPEPRPGAIVLLKLRHPSFAGHCGFCTGNGDFVHVLQHRSVCVERLHHYSGKIAGYYIYKGKK